MLSQLIIFCLWRGVHKILLFLNCNGKVAVRITFGPTTPFERLWCVVSLTDGVV